MKFHFQLPIICHIYFTYPTITHPHLTSPIPLQLFLFTSPTRHPASVPHVLRLWPSRATSFVIVSTFPFVSLSLLLSHCRRQSRYRATVPASPKNSKSNMHESPTTPPINHRTVAVVVIISSKKYCMNHPFGSFVRSLGFVWFGELTEWLASSIRYDTTQYNTQCGAQQWEPVQWTLKLTRFFFTFSWMKEWMWWVSCSSTNRFSSLDKNNIKNFNEGKHHHHYLGRCESCQNQHSPSRLFGLIFCVLLRRWW